MNWRVAAVWLVLVAAGAWGLARMAGLPWWMGGLIVAAALLVNSWIAEVEDADRE